MKHLLVLMMCLLISGCGLFKKTVKTSNSIENISRNEVKSESSQQIKIAEEKKVAVKSKAEIHNSSKTVNQVRKDVDENTQITADNIEIASDGSLKASGNAKYFNKKKDQSKGSFNKEDKKSEVISIDSKAIRKTTVNGRSNTKNSGKHISVEKKKNSQTTSTPDFSWIIWVVIAAVMVFGGFMLGKWLSKILKEKIKK